MKETFLDGLDIASPEELQAYGQPEIVGVYDMDGNELDDEINLIQKEFVHEEE